MIIIKRLRLHMINLWEKATVGRPRASSEDEDEGSSILAFCTSLENWNIEDMPQKCIIIHAVAENWTNARSARIASYFKLGVYSTSESDPEHFAVARYV